MLSTAHSERPNLVVEVQENPAAFFRAPYADAVRVLSQHIAGEISHGGTPAYQIVDCRWRFGH